MRVQFDEVATPGPCGWFADVIDAQRLDKPPEGHHHRLAYTPFGYVEHTFLEVCKPKAKYGIAWEWDTRSDASPRDRTTREQAMDDSSSTATFLGKADTPLIRTLLVLIALLLGIIV